MSFIRTFEKMKMINSLIKKKATGNQEEFARKIGVSRSMLNIYISEMKTMGFPIQYCRSRNSYFYEGDGELVHKLFQASINRGENEKA